MAEDRDRNHAPAHRRRYSFSGATADPSDVESLRLAELIRSELVKTSLLSSDQWPAVQELVDVLVDEAELPPKYASRAMRAIKEREAIRPTGWKYGLAFPNGRVRGLRRIVAAIGLSLEGIEFGCRDGLPARIVVLLLFPEARYARFAPAINDIAGTLEDTAVREAILTARTGAEVVDVIEDAETRDFS